MSLGWPGNASGSPPEELEEVSGAVTGELKSPLPLFPTTSEPAQRWIRCSSSSLQSALPGEQRTVCVGMPRLLTSPAQGVDGRRTTYFSSSQESGVVFNVQAWKGSKEIRGNLSPLMQSLQQKEADLVVGAYESKDEIAEHV
ncbi:hypothetical protein L3Q82_007339 [Scortum barcoo]|uniref:Uncharacterized protein n=1 Tax=Scortum barcoo TaxID=214431 RepID=A0ACB8WTQ5_9TELE|nr:hypothetical protein L3Q82_007339 [Scortum barcoo]